jgi:acyl-coenzyme A thioesterase PaaI-like protein
MLTAEVMLMPVFLMTLADIAIGYNAAFSEKPPLNLVTISLNNDFMSSARLGDWLEVYVSLSKKGRTLLYASSSILKGEVKVLRSNAIYSIVLPKANSNTL